MGQRYYYYVRATFINTEKTPPRQEQAFSGKWNSEQEAWQWATRHYAQLPGAFFTVEKSDSADREVARCQKRTGMLDDGEGTVPQVLGVRFRNQNKNKEQ